ncbi:rhomboid family intramembrane serine protease [Ferruginibacter albus]|uniref:rhomboid family intramembrane serine protease n=1 Tax=Ferruginibacter albus TaxID=2875540 RepID=UPI001CC4D337|nr:rhomboid family intramembrane serine protease [Ferruginibacter albus]UAY51990.1 rhomboid family intramembrane serine protease [Ferruginibacter albus]
MAYSNNGNSIQRTTPIVFNLILINVLVYLAQKIVTGIDITGLGALHYYKSPLFKPYQLVTNMFLHAPNQIFHILFNMFSLWMFGSILERFWGSKRFLIFYLICGLGASLIIELSVPFSAQQFAKTLDAIPAGVSQADIIEAYKTQYSSIGASGAIMGLLAAFAYLFPNTELFIWFIPIPVKAKFFVPIYMVIELFQGVHQFKGDDVGHFAHLGGALVGFLLVLYWNKANRKTFY